MKSLMQRFQEQVTASPDKVAVHFNEQSVTYAELFAQVCGWLAYIRETRSALGMHIGVRLSPSISHVAFLLAAIDEGHPIVPTPPYGAEYATYELFKAADVHCVMTDAGVAYLPKHTPHLPRTVPNNLDNLAVLARTSGTTGKPKLIELTQRCKLARIDQLTHLYNLNCADVILCASPLHTTMGLRLVLTAVTLGCTLVLLDRYSPERWIGAVQRYKVTFTVAVPAQLAGVAALAEDVDRRLSSLECAVTSSAALTQEVRTAVTKKAQNCDVYECYGSSEVAIVSSTGKLISQKFGTLAPGVKVSVDDNCELVVNNSPAMFSGYYKHPPAKSFRTGDVVRVTPTLELGFGGRLDDVINVGGSKVCPADVEAVVSKLPGVKECFAYAVADNVFGSLVGVAIVRSDSYTSLPRTCDLLDELVDYQLPRVWRVWPKAALWRNDQGKLLRRQMREKMLELL